MPLTISSVWRKDIRTQFMVADAEPGHKVVKTYGTSWMLGLNKHLDSNILEVSLYHKESRPTEEIVKSFVGFLGRITDADPLYSRMHPNWYGITFELEVKDVAAPA